MHRSKLDIGGADAGAGGMSTSSGSGASGVGASSSSFDASAMALSTGSLGAGSGSICLANNAPVACSSLPLQQPRGNHRRCVRAIDAIPCSRPGLCRRGLSPPCLIHGQAFERAVEDGEEEPLAHDGVDVDLAALRTTAAGLVFNECSGWGGRGGTKRAGMGDLLVCEWADDGGSWSPPVRPL